MIDDTNPPEAVLADLGREVDRLLRQIPAANVHERPTLVNTQEHAVPRPQHASGAPPRRHSSPVRVASNGAAARMRTSGEFSTRLRTVVPWIGAVSAVGLGLAVTQWPYQRDCGLMLHLYLGVTGSVMIVGGWATVTAWKVRNASVHVIGALVMFWGIVLAAEQILPRIGYAAVPAAWSCTR